VLEANEPVPDRGRQAWAEGEQIDRWNSRSGAAGNGSRCHTHLEEAFIYGGRFLAENVSEWSLNSRRVALKGASKDSCHLLGPKAFYFTPPC
jgi:hypothetical protein